MLVSRLIRELAVVLVCSILVYSPVLGLPRARNDRLGPMPRRATLQAITRPHRAGELLVKFRTEAQGLQRTQVIDAYGKRGERLRGRGNLDRLIIKDGMDLSEVLHNVRQLNAVVEWAEPNYRVTKSVQRSPLPNDPSFGDQWRFGTRVRMAA